jgi:predicted HicB family RNase H-like nuclease
MMEYRGYVAEVSFDDEAQVLHGEVINTRDVITFQADAVAVLEQEFRKSVDVYLQFCKEIGQEPEKPFSGKFVVRLSPETHRRAYLAAKRAGKSLNTWVSDVLQEKLPDHGTPKAPRPSARHRSRKSKVG